MYVALVGIVVLPLYLKYMGAEAYGLVGFFVLLQSLFQLLDMGITPTLTREAARINGKLADAWRLRRLLRLMESIFVATSLMACLVLVAFADTVAANWLQVRQLDLLEVQQAIELMAVIAALRLVGGLYRGVISGLERLVWLNGFNVLMATIRFVFVIPFFVHVGSTPTLFFAYQLLLALIELVVLIVQTYRWLPDAMSSGPAARDRRSLKEVLQFSLGIAFAGAVWLLITSVDKLLLSKVLPLSDYAYYSLAVLAASGVTMVTVPVSNALLPRLASLAAAGDEQGLIRLYGNATQLVALVAFPASLMIAFFPEQVLWAWTGDAELVRHAAPVLRLYALGNGLLAMGAFPYYLQYAKGDLRLHLVGNGLFLVVLIPVLVWSTLGYGAVGAGWTWLGLNVAYFVLWIPRVHQRFYRGLHSSWLRRDVGGIALTTSAGGILAYGLFNWPQDRLGVLASLLVLGVFLLVLGALGSAWIRGLVLERWRRLKLHR